MFFLVGQKHLVPVLFVFTGNRHHPCGGDHDVFIRFGEFPRLAEEFHPQNPEQAVLQYHRGADHGLSAGGVQRHRIGRIGDVRKDQKVVLLETSAPEQELTDGFRRKDRFE